mmetsp:Transcript_32047/g.66908  ORF Transcript_32047/g.66908 Transcript_32047/m.66908 type:complete len:1157 (-) Transcript_32047:327-3797(-)|eukprot:CAMPEP_0172469938 /NCGR_PEP_ID=MMETSP1065-20121228/64964_1 /TAXON_ID=265537 /ORGANISM="Amphiprora paludosa, Strain CCMP125" /LENGTH=1156 /DNA_ID=CAMNT_0013227721 /DNA_START=219 /DNA_END=3689 /DNA_ORIENTATION=+
MYSPKITRNAASKIQKGETSSKRRISPPPEQALKRTRSSVLANEPEPEERADEWDPELPLKSCQDFVSRYAELEPLPLRSPKLPELSVNQVKELEDVLGFGNPGSDGWRDDWNGNLAYAHEDIVNPVSRGRKKQSFRQSLLAWAENNDQSRRILGNLITFVYSMAKVPPAAKKILACVDFSSAAKMEAAVGRVGYDPAVLEQDGWVTSKSEEPEGAIGGPYLIGDMIRWQNLDAVVIAFVHDNDLGDLWKACWIEDLHTFDLEAEEVVEARKKWERRNKPSKAKNASEDAIKQSRANGSSDFRVAGIEEGIVLASSMSPGARPGVFWPARVMHASECSGASNPSKRSIAKYKISVVFLSPYWDSNARGKRGEALSEQANDEFATGELFQVESAEANDGSIKEYTFDPADGVDLSNLEMAFRFTGLPKIAFRCFLDSHRLALGLKHYARTNLRKRTTATERATFGLFDSHPLAVMAPLYPAIVLHLPFNFILSGMPDVKREDAFKQENEMVLNLSAIVEAMKPPKCWVDANESSLPNDTRDDDTPLSSPATLDAAKESGSFSGDSKTNAPQDFGPLLKKFPLLHSFFRIHSKNPSVAGLALALMDTYSRSKARELFNNDSVESSNTREHCVSFPMKTWASLKAFGCDVIGAVSEENRDAVVGEWKRVLERIYTRLKRLKGGNTTLVTTDSHCNLHVTSGQNLERSVRLPAALKGARLAGAGTDDQIQLTNTVAKETVDYIESALLFRVHDSGYLKRMKGRCMAAKTETEVLMLTEDSDGVGGEDTRGCQGSWDAAVHAVAIAVAAVDNVVQGKCSNAFCATRPPGHHAGRKLHAMKAVSNGFCILNAVACAAFHAVSPVSEGGLGLRRVCVIDFDVHHGNGTQDILCANYDPRFLYVSIHAGGVQPNGEQLLRSSERENEIKHEVGSVFPGRCGDSSPHKGVLNIPLGAKVTSHAVGNALLNKITPAVEAFYPDLILLSAGFDAHKNDPMGLGALSAEDFGHITEATCQLAFKTCSGRVVSVLEGGYGVPCCRPQKDLFLPNKDDGVESKTGNTSIVSDDTPIPQPDGKDPKNEIKESIPAPSEDQDDSMPRPQPSKLAELGEFLPLDMDDQVSLGLQRKLERCHDEGFIECVQAHVSTLAKCSARNAARENGESSE